MLKRERMRRWLGGPALGLAATVLALALGEVLIRVLDRAPEVKPIWVSSHDSVYQRSTNPLLSYELKAGYRNDDPDLIQTYERTNAHGQRDVERTLEKPVGVRRIILLGDSVVEGAGIRQHETMSQQLESLFPGGHTEVLNFGVSGYCTLAEVELLRVKGLAFEPDVVVVVFVENDFLNFNRQGFALEGIHRPALAKHLFLHSHLFRLLAIRANLFHFGTEADPAAWNRKATGDNNVVEGLAQLSGLARQHGLQAIVAIWPSFLDDAITDSHVMPESPHELVVERLAQMYGIPAVRLSNYFRRAWRAAGAGSSPRLLYTIGDELHPSAEGCRVAATALEAILANLEAGPDARASQSSAVLAPEAGPAAIAAALALGQEQAPDYAEVLNRLGNEAVQSRKLQDALKYYRMALAEDPSHADAHNGLGIVHKYQGDLAAAATHFERAVRIAPKFFEARYNLGVVLEQQGKLREAAAQYERVLKIQPDQPALRERLREVRNRLRRTQRE